MRCWNMSLNCLARSSSTCLLCPSGTTHWLMLKLLLLLLPVEAPNYSMQLQRQFTERKTVRLCAKLFASQYAKFCRSCAAYSTCNINLVRTNTDLMYACSQLHLHVVVPAAFDCSLSAIFSQWLVASEDIPCLEAVVQSCQSATAFAEKEVKDAVTEWWTQPAVHAVPWVQRKRHQSFLLPSVVCPV